MWETWIRSLGWEDPLEKKMVTHSSIQSLSQFSQLCPILWDPITNSQSFLKLMSIEMVMPSNHLICHPLLLLPSIFPSIRVFSNESVLHIRWPQYWRFSFNISPSNEYLGLISFGMDWLDLLAVQGTLKSHLHHQSSKASILWCSAFFTVQLSHLYVTTGKTIGLTRQTFVSKVSAVEQHESTICIRISPPSSACLFFELISFSSAYVENPLGHTFEVEICSL